MSKNQNKPTVFVMACRILLPLAVVALALFIFSRSGLPGDVSGENSQKLAA